MVVVYCYLERKDHKVLKFHVTSSSYFEISFPFFKHHPPISDGLKALNSNKHRGHLLKEICYNLTL